jgi:hypothetical protein
VQVGPDDRYNPTIFNERQKIVPELLRVHGAFRRDFADRRSVARSRAHGFVARQRCCRHVSHVVTFPCTNRARFEILLWECIAEKRQPKPDRRLLSLADLVHDTSDGISLSLSRRRCLLPHQLERVAASPAPFAGASRRIVSSSVDGQERPRPSDEHLQDHCRARHADACLDARRSLSARSFGRPLKMSQVWRSANTGGLRAALRGGRRGQGRTTLSLIDRLSRRPVTA